MKWSNFIQKDVPAENLGCSDSKIAARLAIGTSAP